MKDGKRVFKKNSAPKKDRKINDVKVLQLKDWQKEIIRVFNSLEKRIRKVI